MFGKVFVSMYEGSLYGQWQAIITMQQLIVLADAEGYVDMTPPAIAARTSIPLEHIETGLKILSEPDPYSRTPDNDGRRIELIDPDRPWGWRLVNHAYYRDLASKADKREKDRVRIAEKRAKSKVSQPVADSREPSRKSPMQKQDANAEAKEKKKVASLPDWLPLEAWQDFVDMRKKGKAPLTDKAVKLQIDALDELRKQGQDPAAVLNQSTMNGWKSLFAVKDGGASAPKNSPAFRDFPA